MSSPNPEPMPISERELRALTDDLADVHHETLPSMRDSLTAFLWIEEQLHRWLILSTEKLEKDHKGALLEYTRNAEAIEKKNAERIAAIRYGLPPE